MTYAIVFLVGFWAGIGIGAWVLWRYNRKSRESRLNEPTLEMLRRIERWALSGELREGRYDE